MWSRSPLLCEIPIMKREGEKSERSEATLGSNTKMDNPVV